MPKIEEAFYNLGYLEQLSGMDTPIHRIDPRAKLISTLVFIICVMSFHKYDISALFSFIIYPVITASMGYVDFKFLGKSLLLISPFAILIGLFNPLFDTKAVMYMGNTAISGGWLSFASIIIRFILTVSAAFILIATTGFFSVCLALERLLVPRVFVVQLMFLYRYIHVLFIESIGLVRARALRSFDNRGMGLGTAGSLIGHLLLRTINRARRIHISMLSRGFDGEIRLGRRLSFGVKDALYTLTWSSIFILFRLYNVPLIMGNFFKDFLL